MPSKKLMPLMVPDIQQQDIDAVVKVLQSGMLILFFYQINIHG